MADASQPPPSTTLAAAAAGGFGGALLGVFAATMLMGDGDTDSPDQAAVEPAKAEQVEVVAER